MFVKLLAGLDAKGWPPILYRSRMTPLSLMGVRELSESVYQWIQNAFHPNGTFHALTCDVIIKNGHLFYMRAYKENWSGNRLEVGIISRYGEDNPDLLQSLLSDTEALFAALIDGRKRRHMDLRCRTYPDGQELAKKFEDQYARPITNPDIVRAAILLAKSDQYLLLRAISEKKNKSRGPTIDPDTFQLLIDSGLIQRANPDGSLQLTPLGHQLNSQSQWMTIWITHLLMSKGVPAKAIYAGVTREGEEVDLVVSYQQEVWVFELKASDFQHEKAYPFQYRKVQFQADRVIAIAAGKISLAAKRVFTRLAEEKAPSPVLIEGLDKVEAVLTQLIIQARLNVVKEKEKLLCKEMGINFHSFFEHYFYNNPL